VCVVRSLPGTRLTYAGKFSENLVSGTPPNEQRRIDGAKRERGDEMKVEEDGDNGRDSNTNDNQKGNSIRIGKDRTVAPKRFHYRNRE